MVGLNMHNNRLAELILISLTVFELQGFKNLKNTFALILGKCCPDCAVQERLSIPI